MYIWTSWKMYILNRYLFNTASMAERLALLLADYEVSSSNLGWRNFENHLKMVNFLQVDTQGKKLSRIQVFCDLPLYDKANAR